MLQLRVYNLVSYLNLSHPFSHKDTVIYARDPTGGDYCDDNVCAQWRIQGGGPWGAMLPPSLAAWKIFLPVY